MTPRTLALASIPLLAALACASDPPATALDAATAPDASIPDPDAGGTVVEPRFEPLAAAIATDLARANATGASVAVWLDGEIVWVGGFGSADPEGERRPDEETVFMIGSDTKKIAAIVLLQRIAAGEASAETTLGAVLPDLEMARAPEFPGVTAHELLTHQAGLVDGIGEGTTRTTDEVLRTTTYGRFARDTYAMVPHGRFFNYCNPAFSMAGMMAETLAAEPWADLARTGLFEPLGMTRTFARKADVDANHATGVGVSGPRDDSVAPVSFEDTWEDAFIRPAGLVWSTPSDQMRLARFLVEGDEDVLPADLLARMHADHVPTHPDLPGHYGYGLFLSDGIQIGADYYEVPLWSHGGNTLTHTSTFYVLPEQRFAISILSNGLGDDFTGSVVTAIATLVDLPDPVARPAPTVDESVVDGLVGTYVDDFNVGEVIVTREGAGLGIEMPALDAAGVPYSRSATPVSSRVWRASIQGQQLLLELYEGPEGETYMVHRAFVALRAAPSPEPGPTPPPAITPRPRPSRETILRARERARLEAPPRLLP